MKEGRTGCWNDMGIKTPRPARDLGCSFIIPLARTSLTDLSIDERLGKVAKIVEDTCVFQENWPPVA